MATPKVPESPWQQPKFTGTPWWTKETIVLVTGSNRGIGYELVHELLKYGFTCIVTDIDDTEAALHTLKAEGFGESVFAHSLDITSSTSVDSLAKWVKEKFGGIDILINNAGVWKTSATPEDGEATLNVNYFGTTKVTNGLLPLVKPGGRIINVTSRTGFYQRLGNEEAKSRLQNVDELTFDSLDDIANGYLEDIKRVKPEEKGWIASVGLAPQYSESKMLVSAYTLVLAKILQTYDKKVYTCAFCPGFTETAMTKGRFIGGLVPGPMEVGLDTGLWLVLLPEDEFAKRHGKLLAERVEYPYTWVPWIDPFAPPA